MSELYCRNCGNIVQDEDIYCRTCGSSTKSITVWQAVGIGMVIGIIAVVLVFTFYFNPVHFDNEFPFLSSYETWYISKIYGQFLVFTGWELIFSIAGALIGRSRRGTRRAIWIGSIIGSLFPIIAAIAFVLLIILSGLRG